MFDCDQTLFITNPFNITRHPSDLFNLIQQGTHIIQQGTHIISTVTVLLHIVTTIRFFIKSPEEGRLDCPKYRENQLVRRFSLLFFHYSLPMHIIPQRPQAR